MYDWRTQLWRIVEQHDSPKVRLWVQLSAGVVVLLIAAWIFGGVAEDVVTGDPLTIVDRILAGWLHVHARPSVTPAMLLIAELAGPRMITIGALVTALALTVMRRWHWLLSLVLVVPGGVILNELLKLAFRRARPSFDTPILVLNDYGFPSGHTMIATLFYGYLALFLVKTLRGWRWRALVMIIVGGLIMLIGLSRMYLGVHYLSDVLAAMAAGVAWLVLCVTAVATLGHRRR